MKNERYNYYKNLHPEWSEEQIWTAVSLDMESDKIIDKGAKDINFEDPDLIQQILIGAERWIEEVLPAIYEKVKAFFQRAIATIGEWIRKGVQYVKDLIDIIFNNPIY